VVEGREELLALLLVCEAFLCVRRSAILVDVRRDRCEPGAAAVEIPVLEPVADDTAELLELRRRIYIRHRSGIELDRQGRALRPELSLLEGHEREVEVARLSLVRRRRRGRNERRGRHESHHENAFQGANGH
jgi:hypothetical protein